MLNTYTSDTLYLTTPHTLLKVVNINIFSSTTTAMEHRKMTSESNTTEMQTEDKTYKMHDGLSGSNEQNKLTSISLRVHMSLHSSRRTAAY